MKVVVGLFHSPEGDAALQRAADEARLRGGSVVLVAFVPTPHDVQGSRRYSADRSAAVAAGEAEADALRAHGLEVAVQAPIGAHSPADAILQVAAEEAADLIVVGIRRRSPVGKLVLGSNSQDILLGANVPVLAVKPARED